MYIYYHLGGKFSRGQLGWTRFLFLGRFWHFEYYFCRINVLCVRFQIFNVDLNLFQVCLYLCYFRKTFQMHCSEALFEILTVIHSFQFLKFLQFVLVNINTPAHSSCTRSLLSNTNEYTNMQMNTLQCKNIYCNIRIGQHMIRPAESELRRDGWSCPD